jgi:prepilin-type N-terminal cleavage/methylation domain-containing protein
MNPDRAIWNRVGRASRRRGCQAYTLTEVMVTMAIVLLVMAAILSCHVFGMRLFEITKAKLGASDDARAAIGAMVLEIRAAKLVRIGSGDLATFNEAAVHTPQAGSAIQVYASTNTSTFVRYFWDASDQKLKRATNNAPDARVVASSVSNQMNQPVFTAEDFAGNVLTNSQNNRVIGLTLQFHQLQYPAVVIGPGHFYDFYQLRTKITRRTLE